MTSGPAKWAEEVKGLYEDDIVPGYIKAMVSPMRSIGENEECWDAKNTYKCRKLKNPKNAFLFSINFQTETEYNAFERDITVLNIFFGKTTAIGKGTPTIINTLHTYG